MGSGGQAENMWIFKAAEDKDLLWHRTLLLQTTIGSSMIEEALKPSDHLHERQASLVYDSVVSKQLQESEVRGLLSPQALACYSSLQEYKASQFSHIHPLEKHTIEGKRWG